MSFVGENGRIPLSEFDLEIAFNDTLARETPTLRDFEGGKDLKLDRIDTGFALQHADPAASAATMATAGEFDSLVEKKISERSSPRRGQFGAGGLKDDSACRILSQDDSSVIANSGLRDSRPDS